jgi:hypothetical protein
MNEMAAVFFALKSCIFCEDLYHTPFHGADWCRGDALDLYLGSTCFESRPGRWLT